MMDNAARILTQAIGLHGAELQQLLDRECGSDAELRRQVETLLSEAGDAEDFFDGLSVGLPVPEGPEEPLIPETDRYQAEGIVGRGGMGVVVKVRDDQLSRNLAMKVIKTPKVPVSAASKPRSSGGTVSSPIARFLEEAQVTAQLEHPGIVPIHELGTAEDTAFFTMQLVKGRELNEVFDLARAEAEGWNRSRAVGVLVKACQAVAYAHSKGVIHRDLKPRNIMVGRFGEVYVMDWGLAKVSGKEDLHDVRIQDASSSTKIESHRDGDTSAELQEALMTMDGAVVGTPAVMPPEQAEGRTEAIDQRSDVYALGAILYSLLGGHVPYVKPGARVSSRTVLAMVIQGPPQPVREIDPEAPMELVAICDKAMARDQRDRYPSSLELAEDLQAWIDGRVVKAYESGTGAELRKWFVRNRALAISSIMAVFLLVAGLTGAFLIQRAANQELSKSNAALDQAQQTISDQLHVVQKEKAELTLAKGIEVALRGDIDDGMFWMIEALEALPENEPAVETAIRRNLAAWSEHVPKLSYFRKPAALYGLSPDGAYVAKGIDDELSIASTEAPAQPISTHRFEGFVVTKGFYHPQLPILAVILSPDRAKGKGASGEVAVVVRFENGEVLQTLPHQALINKAHFSADGTLLYTTPREGSVVKEWNLQTGTLQRAVDTGVDQPFFLRVSPDGRYLSQLDLSFVLDTQSLLPIDALPVRDHVVQHAYHPDGALLIQRSVGDDFILERWTGEDYDQLESSTKSNLFSNEGVYFAADGNVSANVQLGMLEWTTLRPFFSPLRDGAVPQVLLDGTTFATGTGIWQMPTPRTRPAASVFDAQQQESWIGLTRAGSEPIQVSLQADMLIQRPNLTSTNTRPVAARLRHLDTGFPVGRPLRVRGNDMWDVALSKDGTMAATTVVTNLFDWSLKVGETTLWDTQTGRPIHGPLEPNVPIRALEFSPDGSELVATDGSGNFYCWSTATGKQLGSTLHRDSIGISIVYSPDGSQLGVGYAPAEGAQAFVSLMDPNTRLPLGDDLARQPRAWQAHVRFSEDNQSLIYGGWSEGVYVRDQPSGDYRFPLIAPTLGIHDVVISGNSRRFALADSRWVRVFDIATGEPLGTGMQHADVSQCVALNHDGTLAVGGSVSGTVRLWDVATGNSLGPAMAHAYAIWDVHFSRDQRSFTSIDRKGTVKHWPIPQSAQGSPDMLKKQLEVWTAISLKEGTPVWLARDEWFQRQEELTRESPDRYHFADPASPSEWHQARATDAESDREWFIARWHLNRLIDSQPDHWQALARRGRLHVHRGDLVLAREDFARVAVLQGDAALLDWYAHCAYDCRDEEAPAWEAALYFLDALIAAEPDAWQWHADRAEALRALNRLPQSQAAFRKALALDQNRPFIPEFTQRMIAEKQWHRLAEEYRRGEAVGWLSMEDWQQWRRCAKEMDDDALERTIQAAYQKHTGTTLQ